MNYQEEALKRYVNQPTTIVTSNTPETEVLRIEGNVTVPLTSMFEADFNAFMRTRDYSWSGNIVPQDDPTGMRLYPVEVVEGYQRLNRDYEEQIIRLNKTKSENDKAFLSLSEELSKKKEAYRQMAEGVNLMNKIIESLYRDKAELKDKIQALEERLELSEQTSWRTFIKWWKELWKN